VSSGDSDLVTALEYLEWIWLTQLPGASALNGGVYRLRANPLDYLSPSALGDPAGAARVLADDAVVIGREWLTRSASFWVDGGGLTERVAKLIDMSVLFSVEPLERLLPRTLSLDGIRRSSRILRITLTNWRTGAVHIVGNADMTEDAGYRWVMASLAIPGLFPSVDLNGAVYVDGAVVMNTPLAPAIECRADVLHVVSVEPDLGTAVFRRPRSTAETVDRTMSIMFEATTTRDVEVAAQINRGIEALEKARAGRELTAAEAQAVLAGLGGRPAGERPYRKIEIHRYRPSSSLGGVGRWLDFNQATVAALIDRGFADTVEHDCSRQGCDVPS
jgi:hypothetical protein